MPATASKAHPNITTVRGCSFLSSPSKLVSLDADLRTSLDADLRTRRLLILLTEHGV
jgi:hypothetical protein